MVRRVLVGDNERILLIQNKRLTDILAPGEHWIATLGRDLELVRFNVGELIFVSPWANFITVYRPELAARYFIVIETSPTHVAAVYADGKLIRVIAPGTRALYWRGAVSITFDLIEVGETPEVPARILPALARLGRESNATFAVIEEGKRGLLYLDGKLAREIGAGTFAFWNVLATPRIEILEMRRQTVDVSGQEILTKDKVTIRVNVSAVFDIVNVTAARSTVKDVNEHLYRTLQIAVRQTLGKRTLEEVLAEKADIDELVSAEVRREMEMYGVRVGAIALKDIILPGDIRDILNPVVTAETQAPANLIRRREETAATRSLLNTAKLMEDNPLLIRMKELETLEKIADKVDKITVVGGFDELLSRTVTLRGK
jgi:regulator of protease activity HflC (stomatin/prohibitin superfamily)